MTGPEAGFNARLARCLVAESVFVGSGGAGLISGQGAWGWRAASLAKLVLAHRPDLSSAPPEAVMREFALESLLERARSGGSEDKLACRGYLSNLPGFDASLFESGGGAIDQESIPATQHGYAAMSFRSGETVARACAAVRILSGRGGFAEEFFDQPLERLEEIVRALDQAEQLGEACPSEGVPSGRSGGRL